MRPSATRPTSFWRGESGPFEGLSDAPILIVISSQGFLMRSRMRVLFFRQAEMLSLEIWSVSALLLLWFRQPVAAMAWRLQLRLEPMMIACDALRLLCAAQKSVNAAHASCFYRSDPSPESYTLLRWNSREQCRFLAS